MKKLFRAEVFTFYSQFDSKYHIVSSSSHFFDLGYSALIIRESLENVPRHTCGVSSKCSDYCFLLLLHENAVCREAT